MKLPYAFSLLFTLFAFGFNDSVAEQFLEIDKKTGHYKSLSYDAITDQGLSWQDRAKLFGGETVYYEDLNNEQRTEKENELKRLNRLSSKCVKNKYSPENEHPNNFLLTNEVATNCRIPASLYKQ